MWKTPISKLKPTKYENPISLNSNAQILKSPNLKTHLLHSSHATADVGEEAVGDALGDEWDFVAESEREGRQRENCLVPSHLSDPSYSLVSEVMEFKFRAIDDRPPPYPASSSSFSYFSKQAL